MNSETFTQICHAAYYDNSPDAATILNALDKASAQNGEYVLVVGNVQGLNAALLAFGVVQDTVVLGPVTAYRSLLDIKNKKRQEWHAWTQKRLLDNFHQHLSTSMDKKATKINLDEAKHKLDVFLIKYHGSVAVQSLLAGLCTFLDMQCWHHHMTVQWQVSDTAFTQAGDDAFMQSILDIMIHVLGMTYLSTDIESGELVEHRVWRYTADRTRFRLLFSLSTHFRKTWRRGHRATGTFLVVQTPWYSLDTKGLGMMDKLHILVLKHIWYVYKLLY